MLIKVNQTKANFAAEFEVLIDGVLTYNGNASWVSSILANELLTPYGTMEFKTKFMLVEELKNCVPLKWLWSDVTGANHAVLTANDKTVGKFCTVSDKQDIGSVCSAQYQICYEGYDLRAYPIDKGINQFTPIFKGDTQIAQMNKHRRTEDKKDWYELYLLDEYSNLAAVLSLFVVYYDSYNYGNRGQAVSYSSKVSYQWSYSKFKKLYDPAWLTNHFTVTVDLKITEMKMRMKKRVRLTLGLVFGGCVLVGLIFLILWLAGIYPPG